jgi:peptidoglycan/LPS O-acetylase OafA/YrhL
VNARADRFPLFDSFRAIAALAIFAYHALGFALVPGSDAALRPYIANLSIGLPIFFVISGFLLYRPIVKARASDTEWLPLGVYAWRRFLRIVPAYWVALLVIAVCIDTPGILTLHGIPDYWLFGQVYSADTALGGIPQAWSLDVEVLFYVLLPCVAFAMRSLPGRDRAARLRSEWAMLGVLFCAAVAFNALMLNVAGPDRYATVLHTLPSFLDTFAFGMGLAVASVALEGRPEPSVLRPLDRFPGIAWAAGLALYVLVSLALDDKGGAQPLTNAEFLIRRELFALIAVCLLLPGVFGDQQRGLVRRFLANPVLLWIGLVSYGFYLYHVAVITQLQRWDFHPLGGHNQYLFAIDALLPSLALAAASYYVVERPALSLKRIFKPTRKVEPVRA